MCQCCFLLLAAPFAWWAFYKSEQTVELRAVTFLWLIVALCVGCDGQPDRRAWFGRVVECFVAPCTHIWFCCVAWLLFSHELLARTAFYVILTTVVVAVNLGMTLTGVIPQG